MVRICEFSHRLESRSGRWVSCGNRYSQNVEEPWRQAHDPYRICTHVSRDNSDKDCWIHARGKLCLGLMNTVAGAASDSGLGVRALFPFRVLLPMLLDMPTGPPG